MILRQTAIVLNNYKKMRGDEKMLVYVVEDDTDISEIECYALETNGYDTVPVTSGRRLKEEMTKKLPDMIILDIMLPGEDGIRILSGLQSSHRTRQIPVIMVTAKDTEIEKVKCLDAGADDYITKPFGVMEFNARVNALIRRTGKEKMPQGGMLSVGNIQLNDERHLVTVNGEEIKITYKEYELLKYLMINKAIVLSRDKIMEAVWGFDFQGESRTVDMHIKTLRQKLGEEKNHIKTVRNVGYKIE